MSAENEIVIFESNDGEVALPVKVDLKSSNVWLNRDQMSKLFDRDIKTIGKHINNALREELRNLDTSTVAKFATVQLEGNRNVNREIEYFNSDVIISVGYRVKSRRGIEKLRN